MGLKFASLPLRRGKETSSFSQKKQSWKGEHVEEFVGYIKDYKTFCDLDEIDAEADLKEMYSIAQFTVPLHVGFPVNLVQRK